MASLYRRATPSQKVILRMVEGAIKNAQDYHPEIKLTPAHRRSIAKRAAGTLTAQWPEVLAAGVKDRGQPSDCGAQQDTVHPARSRRSGNGGHRGAVAAISGRPLRAFKRWLYQDMSRIRREEHPQYVAAMIAVLRKLAELSPASPTSGTTSCDSSPSGPARGSSR